eukprot:TRINITY_DN4911_c0_g1_i1.p1 TRINITY_DN4911_c0_g1~~TRINITY_DN4911_c0_g1_i1.p1  ORF type:complete len:342 (-),score=76.18 TRINITY_DN4911_c0_g1_i1:130-1155(-)
MKRLFSLSARRAFATKAKPIPKTEEPKKEIPRDQKKVALITGGNRGIGLEVVRQLAEEDVFVLMGSRSAQRGKSSVALLQSLGLKDIEVLPIDVTREESVKEAKKLIQTQYGGGLDIFINNAGVHGFSVGKDYDERWGFETINVNYYGMKRCLEHFVPSIMKPNSKVVNMASVERSLFVLDFLPPPIQKILLSPKITFEQLNQAVEQFKIEIKKSAGAYSEEKWPKSAYGISNLATMIMTRIAAADLLGSRPDLQMYCCTPGYARTEMTSKYAFRDVSQAAEDVVSLVLGFQQDQGLKPEESAIERQKTGSYWSDGRPINMTLDFGYPTIFDADWLSKRRA